MADQAQTTDDEFVEAEPIPERPSDADEAVLWDELYGDQEPDGENPEEEPEAGNPVEEPATAAEEKAAAEAVAEPDAGPDEEPTQDPMIPKWRFDEVVAKQREAEAEAQYQKGKAEGMAQVTPSPEAVKGPTAVEQIATIDEERGLLADQVDDGELSMREFSEQSRALDQKQMNLYQVQAKEEAKRQEVQAQVNNQESQLLQDATKELEAAHPHSLMIPQHHPIWQRIQAQAQTDLLAQGVDNPYGTETGILKLRTRMAELATEWGPEALGEPKQPAGGKTTAAQRRAKLDLATNHPTDVSKLGSDGTLQGEISESDIETMSDEEIEALPESTRRRFMPG